ncbi:MAG: hypothetical protein AABZ02_07060 [Bacteroidota bacterium]
MGLLILMKDAMDFMHVRMRDRQGRQTRHIAYLDTPDATLAG